ncbi:MAG: chemotaxis protein CheB [Myxococcaceae bacterium]|nr:chemotaxis protein CheB [Myxococcaceae bacterium]
MSTLDAIVIGGSAGALDVLLNLLPQLPRGFSVPIVLVLHVMPRKPSYLVDVLKARAALGVEEAQDKQPLQPGTLYCAPPDYHVLIERGRSLSLSVDDAVHFSRPSIDVLFESAAVALRSRVAGVLLTGGNEDGARGLEAISRAGGITVVQAPKSAQMPHMPEAALARFTPTRVLSSAELGPYLTSLGAPE